MKMDDKTQKGISLFWIFFKAMMFAFTSGAAALPTIEREITDKRSWLSHEEFWTYPVLGQSLPGVISIHNSILIGNRIAGSFGAFMALMGVITPPFVCMLGIGILFQAHVNDPFIQGMIRGIRVVSCALIFGNAVRLLSTVPLNAFSIAIVITAIGGPLLFGFSAFWTIIFCGAAGIIITLLNPTVSARSTNDTRRDDA